MFRSSVCTECVVSCKSIVDKYCRQSLTITVINYSGRASELGLAVLLTYWPTTVQFVKLSASTFVELSWYYVSTIDMPLRNFLSKFSKVRSLGKSSRGKHPYFRKNLNFFIIQCRTGRKKAPMTKKDQSVHPFRLIVTDTYRQTDWVIASTHESIVSRDWKWNVWLLQYRPYQQWGARITMPSNSKPRPREPSRPLRSLLTHETAGRDVCRDLGLP